MKDIVVKTALITLASIFGVFLIVFGALSIFSPLTLAKVFDGTGGYASSVYFYEKHYKKTGSIEDLAVLTMKINQEIDAPLAEEYLSELVNHKDFNAFCAKEENEFSSKEYYCGEYAVVLVKNDKLIKALEVCDKFVKENGYTKFNPYSVLLIETGADLTVEQLDTVKMILQTYPSDIAVKASADIEYIEQLKTNK